MGEKEKLVAKQRTVLGKQVRSLRKNVLTPVVIYGNDRKPVALEVDTHDFMLLYRKAGGNTVVSISIENSDGTKENKNVLIHDVAIDPVSDEILHADLLQINMKEKLTTEVPLKFVGDSVAVMDLQGSLLEALSEIEVECLPSDLPREIEVDLAPLVDFESVIHVSDIVVPNGVVILTDPETTVAHVEAPRTDEELEAEAEESTGAESSEAEATESTDNE